MTQSKDDDNSIRLDNATRERINKLAIERKKSINSKQSKADRKNAVFSATDKWRDPLSEANIIPPARTKSDVVPPTWRVSMPVKKRTPAGKRNNEISVSEHTGRESRYGCNRDDDIRLSEGRMVELGDNKGKLDKLLDDMNDSKTFKRRDLRTIASMPATSSHDHFRRRMSSEGGSRSGTSKDVHALKHRPGERPGDMNSDDNSRLNEDRVVESGDNKGKLDKLLDDMNDSRTIKRRDSRTVASMPATSSQENNRRRMSSEGGSRSGTSKDVHALKHRPGERPGDMNSDDNSRLNEERVVELGEKKGRLDKLLDDMNDSKTIKRRDSRTIASMPATSSQENNRRRMSSEGGSRSGTSKDVHALKHRPGERPGEMKRRTSSPCPKKKSSSSTGPHHERKRSSSIGPLKKKKKDPSSPRKSPGRSTQSSAKGSPDGKALEAFFGVEGKSKSMESSGAGTVVSAPVLRKKESSRHGRSPSQSRRSGNKGSDDRAGLDEILRIAEQSESKRSSGTLSPGSTPGSRKKESSRRLRRSAHGPFSPRRARSVDIDEPLVEEIAKETVPRRRAKSVDYADLGVGEEELKDETPLPVKRNFSLRLSKRLNSLRNLAGFGGSFKKLKNPQEDAPNTEKMEQAPKRSSRAAGRRESVQSKEKPKRASSAGPLSRPGRKGRVDRRAALTKSKRKNDPLHQPDEDDEEGDEDENEIKPPQRAQSMMLHREATRRGKSTSLMDLQQYSEEEIHSTSYFASNHVLVNRERMKRGLRPLTRNVAMDQLARENAEKIAKAHGLSTLPATYVGNVLKGESIRAIHRAIMQNKEGRERANILSPYFQDFGIGTAKGEDKMLYICQLFSERLELTIIDTTAQM